MWLVQPQATSVRPTLRSYGSAGVRLHGAKGGLLSGSAAGARRRLALFGGRLCATCHAPAAALTTCQPYALRPQLYDVFWVFGSPKVTPPLAAGKQ
jgi:hypothetical protein